MAIFGHNTVIVEKDTETKSWNVYAPSPRHLLMNVLWSDAFKVFTATQQQQYPDFIEAIATCQSHANTALTYDEERAVLGAIKKASPGYVDSTTTTVSEPVQDNVVSMADFKKGRR